MQLGLHLLVFLFLLIAPHIISSCHSYGGFLPDWVPVFPHCDEIVKSGDWGWWWELKDSHRCEKRLNGLKREYSQFRCSNIILPPEN